ncbi:MAG: methyltransferase type 11 [Sphingobacterium sp.]
MKTVQIFRTNVSKNQDAVQLTTSLLTVYPNYKVNFDLDDEENILRVETNYSTIATRDIVQYMMGLGYNCERIE